MTHNTEFETEELGQSIDYDEIEHKRKERNLASFNAFESHFKALAMKSAEVVTTCENKPEDGAWVLNFKVTTKAMKVGQGERIGGAIYQGTVKPLIQGFEVVSTLKVRQGKVVPVLDVCVQGVDELLFIHQRLNQFKNLGLWLPYWLSKNGL